LGNFYGLLNLILFVFLLNFLAAILAAQMFRGTLPAQDWNGNTIHVTFRSVYNSFLGMYQIFSSENWTTTLYYVTNYDIQYNTAWMGAAFFILWFILANFIVMNMFIAVIQENFDVSEDEKRLQQVKAFLEQKETGGSSHGNLSLSTIFKYGLISGKRRDPLAFGSATTELLLKDAVVKDFLDQGQDPSLTSPDADMEAPPVLRPAPTSAEVRAGTLSSIWTSVLGKIRNQEPNPFYSRLEFSRAYEDLDPRQMAKEVMSAHARRKRAQREYLHKHPTYNVSLFLFHPSNPIRRFCQRIVGPGRGGDRIEGVAPSIPVWYAFSAFIYAAIVAMVILACVTTPLYQREYFQNHVFSVRNWFVFSDMGFAILFAVEALIKVIADGFFWTPNAFFRSSWGFIDGIVLITLWINIATALFNEGQVSRVVGAFKALRALRLLNVSDSARNNFHAVIVRGGIKVVSAAFVSLSLLIPFAIYGLNLFLGKLLACNDTNSGIDDLNDCVGEYGTNNPYNWNVYAPRVASNSYYSFDNFGGSLFILFQIVSQEGWVDVMWAAETITGAFKQPQPFASQGNALFFVIFNLLGSVFVLTLFVSVFMRNYTEQTGVAFLTSDQRSWLELRKLLRQISPSKRPLPSELRRSWKEWCYRRAVRKSGRWHKTVTIALVIHLMLLCIEFYPSIPVWDTTRGKLNLSQPPTLILPNRNRLHVPWLDLGIYFQHRDTHHWPHLATL
jgi:voltage-dependent calcium channel